MKFICPICKHKLSKKWIWLSNYNGEYQCKTCNTVIKWRKLLRFIDFISVFGALVISDFYRIFVLSNYQFDYWTKFLIRGIIGFLLLFVIRLILVFIIPSRFIIKRK